MLRPRQALMNLIVESFFSKTSVQP